MCIIKEITINLPSGNTGLSSVGLERCLDRAEVTGSNPVVSTIGWGCECGCECDRVRVISVIVGVHVLAHVGK